jgi:DNA-binding transcriptional regulator YbjK
VPRRTKGIARRQAIVDAAVELIAEQEPLSHRAAARRAGVPDSAPSYYFDSIDELTLEAFRTVVRGFVDRVERLTAAVEESALTPEQVIDAYVDGAAGEIGATRQQLAAYLYATDHPEMRAEVEAALAAMAGAAEGVLRAIGRPDLCWAAPIVVAFVDGYTIQQLVAPGGYAGLRDGLLALLNGLESHPA